MSDDAIDSPPPVPVEAREVALYIGGMPVRVPTDSVAVHGEDLLALALVCDDGAPRTQVVVIGPDGSVRGMACVWRTLGRA